MHQTARSCPLPIELYLHLFLLLQRMKIRRKLRAKEQSKVGWRNRRDDNSIAPPEVALDAIGLSNGIAAPMQPAVIELELL